MTPRHVVIVGGVAGGMSTATRLRRLDEAATITVIERSGHVSYANCGLPYFVGGVIEDEDDLLLQTPERLFDRFRLDVRVDTEVVDIDAANHEVTTRSTVDGRTESIGYDKLVLSPGAVAVRPPIPGFDRVRVLRTVEDAERLAADVTGRPATAVVIGAGFVGLETAENLVRQSIAVTVVEAADQVLTPLDPELAILVAAELASHGVVVETGVAVSEVTAAGDHPGRRSGDPGRARGRIHRRSPRRPPGRDGRPGHRAPTAASPSTRSTGPATRTSTPWATPSRRRTGSEGAIR